MINTQGKITNLCIISPFFPRRDKNVNSNLLVRKFRHRVTLKKRYGLLITQQSKSCQTTIMLYHADYEAENQKVLGQ